MAKKVEEIPGQFPVTVDEFLEGLGKSQVEIKKAFVALMRFEGNTAHRAKSEWAALLDLFRKKPTSVTWTQWLETNKGGK
jgi:hypothetical protein